MQYDGGNPLHAQQARTRLEHLVEHKKVFELTEKKPRRTSNQNKYLHLLLGFFACQTGNTLEYVKRQYFKELVNPELFLREHEDKYLGRIHVLRSSASLDTSELTTAIERFRNWASSECGIYLPEPHEEQILQMMELEVERYRNYI